MYVASGQRESATNRLGEHGGMGFGPMRHNAKFSTSRLIVGGISRYLMRVRSKETRACTDLKTTLLPIPLPILTFSSTTSGLCTHSVP
jgi:hypothetical protein